MLNALDDWHMKRRIKKMSDYNWCHNPNCHTIETQSRVRGSGTNKVLRTRKIKVRENFSDCHWWQGWENHFCNLSCFFQFTKIHWQEIVRIAPGTKAQETPIKVEKEKYESTRWDFNKGIEGRPQSVPYMATRTIIKSIDND